jgi:hypothetical protein
MINDTLSIGTFTVSDYSNGGTKKENISYKYPIENFNELEFNLITKLTTDTYDSTTNNLISQNVKISDFYALDDGTAENGYGIYGNGTLYGFVAQKYYTYQADYLTGISVYFNKTFRNQQPRYFHVFVWDNNNGIPGNVLYEEEGLEIDFSQLNSFVNLEFTESVSVSDTFFVGWKKTSELLMNIGLDANSTTENYKYYNIFGDWQRSTINGVMMLRPIFGTPKFISKPTENYSNVFPNPVTDILTIEIEKYFEKAEFKIYDIFGKLLYSDKINNQIHTLDFANFNSGIYFLHIIIDDKIEIKKVVKN